MDGYNLFLKKNIHPKECYIFVLYKSPANRIKEFVFPQQGIYFDKNFRDTKYNKLYNKISSFRSISNQINILKNNI